MSGTVEGGKSAYQTNLERHGKDFYQRIGAKGGQAGTGHAFAHGRVGASEAGKLGGRPKGWTRKAWQERQNLDERLSRK